MDEQDSVTILPLGGALARHLGFAVEKARRDGTRVAVLIADTGDLKSHSNTWGLPAGDAWLLALADVWDDIAEPVSLAFRSGGDEICMVVTHATLESAREMAAKVVRHAATTSTAHLLSGYGDLSLPSMSPTVGVALFPNHADGADDVLAAARTAARRGKNAGRLCVCVSGEAPAPQDIGPRGRDELTGLLSRRAWMPLAGAAIEAARHDRTSVAVLLGDVDGFKYFNDSHGLSQCDLWLRECAHVVARLAPNERAACRIGGDEFAVLLPRATTESALALAEEVRREVERLLVAGESQVLGPLSMSVGVALFPEHAYDLASLLAAADLALYDRARLTRNGVRMAAST